MSNEILRQYPLEPIVRREFLKRASLATLVWGASPGASFAQTATTGSLLIQGGLIVTSERQFLADIRARAGKIEQIAPDLTPLSSGEEQVVDARGMLVLPGGIDPHTHLPGSVEGLASGTATALAGGITTIGAMTFPRTGENVTEAVSRVSSLIAQQAMADVLIQP